MASNINYKYLRPLKAQHLKSLHNNPLKKYNNLRAEVYENATILPLRSTRESNICWGQGGITDLFGNYIESSASGNLWYGGYEFDDYEVSHQTVVYCGYFRRHWGDFIVDCTTRLYYFLDNLSNDDIDKYVFFVEENGNKEVIGNFKEFFTLLGIWDKLLLINKPTRFDRVIIPEISYDRIKRYYSDSYLKVFQKIREEALKGSAVSFDGNIFLTRSRLQKSIKMEFGTVMLDNFFEKNDYEIVSPERICLKELICKLYNAKSVACISGTLPHNMLFIGSKSLFIIERSCLNNTIQPDINRMLDLQTTYIDANVCIYPVELAYGPFVYIANKQLIDFASDNHYTLPDEHYFSKQDKKQLFRRFVKEYKNEHYLSIYMPEWMVSKSEIIFEAANDGWEYFHDSIKSKEKALPIKLFEDNVRYYY